jgi:hypothetical protein
MPVLYGLDPKNVKTFRKLAQDDDFGKSAISYCDDKASTN